MAESPERALARLKESFASGLTRDLAYREHELAALERLLVEGERELLGALGADLAKPATEALVSDVLSVRHEVRVLRRGLRRWARPRSVRLPLALLPARARVRHEPLGVVLVVAPWNYPVNLVLAPLAGALAAGNCVVVKPSELAPRSAAVLGDLIARYLDPRSVAWCEGGAEATNALIDGGVDHLFFTGSTRVGRIVAARAAARLIPATLELGGKSPAYVDATADVGLAARRIVFGKFFNAGQTCIAPDYVLVHREVAPAFRDELVAAVRGFYGANPKRSPDFGRIIDVSSLDRLAAMLSSSGGVTLCGGEIDREERYLAPTIVSGARPESSLLNEEIFGPILPVVEVDDAEGAIAEIAKRPTPLCAYLFTHSSTVRERFLTATRSGSLALNTTLEQFVASGLPFGGVGESGSGRYHGRFGFETFSQLRPVLEKGTWPELRAAYPPYRALARALLRRVL